MGSLSCFIEGLLGHGKSLSETLNATFLCVFMHAFKYKTIIFPIILGFLLENDVSGEISCPIWWQGLWLVEKVNILCAGQWEKNIQTDVRWWDGKTFGGLYQLFIMTCFRNFTYVTRVQISKGLTQNISSGTSNCILLTSRNRGILCVIVCNIQPSGCLWCSFRPS